MKMLRRTFATLFTWIGTPIFEPERLALFALFQQAPGWIETTRAVMKAAYRAVALYARVVRAFKQTGATWREALCLPLYIPQIAGGTSWINDLRNNVVSAIVFAIAARTTTGNSAGVDMISGFGNCFGVQFVGAVSGTTPTLDTKFQESDTSGGTYADCSPSGAFAQVVAADKLEITNFKRSKRFVRAASTIAGTTPSFTYGVAILQMKKAI